MTKTSNARLQDERPEGCSKGCTGRMCRDALNCDAKPYHTPRCPICASTNCKNPDCGSRY